MFGATEEPEPCSITLTTSGASLGEMTFDLRVSALPLMAAAGSWKHFQWSEVNDSDSLTGLTGFTGPHSQPGSSGLGWFPSTGSSKLVHLDWFL